MAVQANKLQEKDLSRQDSETQSNSAFQLININAFRELKSESAASSGAVAAMNENEALGSRSSGVREINEPYDPIRQQLPNSIPPDPDKPTTRLNPMLSRGIIESSRMRPELVPQENSSTGVRSALEQEASALANQLIQIEAEALTANPEKLNGILAQLETLRKDLEERKESEEARLGKDVAGGGSTGLYGSIERLEKEKESVWWQDKALATANAPYALGHFITKVTGIGERFKMDMFKEPPTSLVKELDKSIAEHAKEIEYRSNLLSNLNSTLLKLDSAISGMKGAQQSISESSHPADVSRYSSEFRRYVGLVNQVLKNGVIGSDPELKAAWDASRASVNKGMSELVQQADMAVATVQGVEKVIVIGTAMAATGATGGMAAPLVGLAAGSALGAGLSVGHLTGGAVTGSTEITASGELNRFLEDVKDAGLYSLGGSLSRAGIGAKIANKAMTSAGRIAPAPLIKIGSSSASIFGSSLEVVKRGLANIASSNLFTRSVITHAKAGMIAESPAALYDTYRALGTAELDPTGRLREMGISERSLALRQLTYRIGLAGMGGSLSFMSQGVRRIIGGNFNNLMTIPGPALTQPITSLSNVVATAGTMQFARRGVGELITSPVEMYVDGALSIWSDYRLTGWFYGVNLEPSPEERARMVQQSMTSSFAGRFASRGVAGRIDNAIQNRTQALQVAQADLQNQVVNQANLIGGNADRQVIVASAPGRAFTVTHVPEPVGGAANNLAINLGVDLPMNLSRLQSQNRLLGRAAQQDLNGLGVNVFRNGGDPERTAVGNVVLVGVRREPATSPSPLARERGRFVNNIMDATQRRSSRLAILPTNPNDAARLAYGIDYLADYINEMNPNRAGLGAPTFRERVSNARNPHGRFDSDMRVGEVPRADGWGEGKRGYGIWRIVTVPSAFISNRILGVESGAYRATAWVENISNHWAVAPFRALGAAGITGTTGFYAALKTVPTASIYGSWGVLALPVAVGADLVFSGLRTFAGGAALARRQVGGGEAVEVAELKARWLEGEALAQWANDMNMRLPNSIPAATIAQVQASSAASQAMYQNANRRAFGRTRSLLPFALVDNDLLVPRAAEAIVDNEVRETYNHARGMIP